MPAPTLAGDLIGAVVDAAKYAPRSKQTTIGPSEIGHPCQRRVAYRISQAAITWQDSDPWASIVGTAVHAWLASAFAAANLVMDEPRWLVEQRVHPTPGMPGNCDLYDLHTDTVIDHKVVGTDTLSKAKKNGPSEQYRIQLHTYGLGWERLGRKPQNIAIAFWPRSGFLSGMFLYREPYDSSIATAALERLTNISAAALTLDLEANTDLARLIPATPGDECRYCPYRSCAAGDGGCQDAPTKPIPTSIRGLT